MAYEESLKVYRDLKAVTDTAYEDGYKEAKIALTAQLEEERRQKEEAIVLLLSVGLTAVQISEKLNISVEFIESLKGK